MIAPGMEKWTSHGDASVLAALVEDRRLEALLVGYDSTKEGVQILSLNLIREAIDDIIQQEKVD